MKCCFCNKPVNDDLKAIINSEMHYFCNMEHLKHYRIDHDKISVIRARLHDWRSQLKLSPRFHPYRAGQIDTLTNVLKMMNDG